MVQRTLTWGEVRLTSCLFCLDSAALLVLNEQQFKLFGQIQISQTGSQPHSDTSPYDERSLVGGLKSAFPKLKQWEPTHHSLYLSSEKKIWRTHVALLKPRRSLSYLFSMQRFFHANKRTNKQTKRQTKRQNVCSTLAKIKMFFVLNWYLRRQKHVVSYHS